MVTGASVPDQALVASDQAALRRLAPTGFDPSRDAWFCERGDFWGTVKQLCLCAKCGNSPNKRADEPRHYTGMFKSWLHQLCDECFDSLPDEEPDAIGDRSPTGPGRETGPAHESPGAQQSPESPSR